MFELRPPKCHFTEMFLDHADDGCESVAYWECEHCGHTKEAYRALTG